jgi:hypothetical protein
MKNRRLLLLVIFSILSANSFGMEPATALKNVSKVDHVDAASAVPASKRKVVEYPTAESVSANAHSSAGGGVPAPGANTAKVNNDLATMECYQVINGATSNAVVCAIKPSASDSMSNIIAVIALLVSLGSFWYGWSNDKKVRLQSIEDDYWIRNVISPIGLEPMIKKIIETVPVVPVNWESAAFDKVACGEFGKMFQSEWSQITGSIHVLALLDKDVCRKAIDHSSNIEDAVLQYCSNNMQNKIGANGGYINRLDLQTFMNSELIEIMDCIKQYQISR